METEEKIMNSTRAHNSKFAAMDVKQKAQAAWQRHSDFFNSAEHLEKIQAVTEIVQNFFRVKKGFYVTPRGGKQNPMTVIKVEDPVFPNTLTKKQKQDQFYKPLAELDVEIVYSKGSNSYLFRIR
jgi:hypothetical protein